MKKILVVDVGGSNVKLMISQEGKRRKFPSGPKLTPEEAVAEIKKETKDWDFEAIAVGFPAPVRDGKITKDPKHLGKNWAGFDFAKALGKPVRIINDAALQALGSYHGNGRMLFLGLGTGLGSALVWQDHVLPLELGDLPYQEDWIIEDWLGDDGLEQLGRKDWLRETARAIKQLKLAVIADYVVLGGGNARLIEKLPDGVEVGHNRNVYPGGVRLWENDPDTKRPRWRIM
ncbi:MAG: ROK family protein [Chthoniobacterales bacterium]|nr:ROK family protein [Chthoniobacterales bacterium]